MKSEINMSGLSGERVFDLFVRYGFLKTANNALIFSFLFIFLGVIVGYVLTQFQHKRKRALGVYLLALLSTYLFTEGSLWISNVTEKLHNDYFYIFKKFIHFGFQATPVFIVGNILLISILSLAVYGIRRGKNNISIFSSILYFVPTLFNLIAGMTVLFAGLELLGVFIERVLGVESVTRIFLMHIYNVGRVFFVPYWVILNRVAPTATEQWDMTPIIRDLYGGFFVALGLSILFLGVATWINSKYDKRELIVSGIYRLSRHPQYLGYILWSYGMTILTTFRQHPMRYPLTPTINWLVSCLILVGLAYREELDLRVKESLNYSEYYHKVSFLVPILTPIRRLLMMPFRLIWHNDYPDSSKKILITLILVFLVLSIPELFFKGLYYLWNPYH